MDSKANIHVVTHTHWDREWYEPFETFRMRLARLIDRLLNIFDVDREFRFVFDGQTIVLEDYLAVRPENREKLKELVQTRRLLVGPFYVQNDEFLVSGESHIRNLLLGHRIASEFGHVTKIGYLPDQFGHIAQMPQILAGFNIKSVFAWRGAPEDTPLNFFWESPDGTKILANNTCYVNGRYSADEYIPGLHLSGSPEELADRAAKAIEESRMRDNQPEALLMNGMDHGLPQMEISRMIYEANSQLNEGELFSSDIVQYFDSMWDGQANRNPDSIPVVKSELRDLAHDNLIQGTLSSRMYLKLANHHCQNLMEKYAEQLAAIDWFLGGTYPEEFLWLAWRYLLQNHPHDSICGCSIDPVHREMMTRFEKVAQIGGKIAEEALESLSERVRLPVQAAREHRIMVFNPLGFSRDDVVKAKIKIPASHSTKNLVMEDQDGCNIPLQLLGEKLETAFINRGEYSQRQLEWRVFDVVFQDSGLPALGYNTYRVREKEKAAKTHTLQGLAFGNNRLENEYLIVKIETDGTLTITNKSNGQIYTGCNCLEDGADAGDLYNYSYCKYDRIHYSAEIKWNVALEHNGPLSASYRLQGEWFLPERLTDSRMERSERLVRNIVICRVTLTKGAKYVEIVTELENNSMDHRIRVLFSAGLQCDQVNSEGHFQVIRRSVDLPPDADYTPTYHQKSFVDAGDDTGGLCIINSGLAEFEVRRGAVCTSTVTNETNADGNCNMRKSTYNNGCIVAVTLLRCVGTVMRPDLITRQDGGSPSLPAPEGQCPGKHEFHYAVMPHQGNWEWARVDKTAHALNTPAKVFQLGTGGRLPGVVPYEEEKIERWLPQSISFIRLDPDILTLSCVKRAETKECLVIRFYNPTGKQVNGILSMFTGVGSAVRMDLAENTLYPLNIKNNNKDIQVSAGPFEIVTIGVYR
ncbi:MAG: hypothetical protein FIA99_02415 [Ruminiclostridium sp.]|nr:hypothetical protein [Ruminiclostridium sp.]